MERTREQHSRAEAMISSDGDVTYQSACGSYTGGAGRFLQYTGHDTCLMICRRCLRRRVGSMNAHPT